MPAYDSLGTVSGVPIVTTTDGKVVADSRGKLGSAAFKENSEFAGATHASSHKSDGLDPLSPDDIGAVSKKVPNAAGNLAALDISGNLVDSGKKIEQLQTKLTFDNTPALNSQNPVTSDGVKKAIDGIDLAPYAKTTDLSSHIGDTEKHITAEERTGWNGKASAAHKHTKSDITDFPTSMTPTAHTHTASEITSGTLSVVRGGTGAADAATARSNLGAGAAPVLLTATFPASGWVLSGGCYQQTVYCGDLTTADGPKTALILPQGSTDAAAQLLTDAAYGAIFAPGGYAACNTANYLYARGPSGGSAPTANFTVNVQVRR